MSCLPRSGHEPLSEQRLAIGAGDTSAPAGRPGRRTDLERGLDGDDDELRGLRVDDDVPAEQNAADDLPGVRGRVVRVGGYVSPPSGCNRSGHRSTRVGSGASRLPGLPGYRVARSHPGL